MRNQRPPSPRRQRRFFRSDTESGLARKRHQAEAGLARGLVEILGPIPPGVEQEIRNIAARMEARYAKGAGIVTITPFARGLAIETRPEKLAQRIADALGRSRHARVERAFDDEGRRRILTCRLPEAKLKSSRGGREA